VVKAALDFEMVARKDLKILSFSMLSDEGVSFRLEKEVPRS
jgi:hypothetical protein